MLHHCNVDRLVAMWQAIHYEEAMFTGTARSTGQYATPKDSPVTADSPLKPFFTANMTFHTSRSVANITTFGYTYPEMPGWAMPREGTVAVSLPLRGVLMGNRSVRDFPVGQVVLFLQRSLRAEIWTVRSPP